MRKILFTVLIILFYTSVHSQTGNAGQIRADTITSNADLDDYVGKLITIKGQISYSKIPGILGIDISCDDVYRDSGDPNGKIGIATGILVKTVITEVDPYSSNRGPGVFYRLKDPLSEEDVEVILYR